LVRTINGDEGLHDYWLAAQVTEFRDALWQDHPWQHVSVVETNDSLLAWDTDGRWQNRFQPPWLVWEDQPIREPSPHRLERLSLLHCTRGGCTREDWFDDTSQDVVVGALRDGDRWGVVVVEREYRSARLPVRRTFVATPSFERAVTALQGVMDPSIGAPPLLTPCGETLGLWEIHTFSRGRGQFEPGQLVRRGQDSTTTSTDDIHHAVFEFSPAGICLRRLDADPAQRWIMSHGGEMVLADRYPEASWLEARGGQLVGGRDDGHTITELRGRITRE
jgi:hypothetical protein